MSGGGEWSPDRRTHRGRVVLSGSASLETPAERALDRVVRSGQRVSVLRLYLSRLHPGGPRPHHKRVARCLFDDAVQQAGGQVFACGNGDLVLMAGPDVVAALGALLLRLFRREAAGDRELLGVWSLPADEASVRSEFAVAPEVAATLEDSPAPLGAIAAIGALLTAVPHTEFIRRQRAVRIVGGRLTDLFQELSVSVPAIEARIGMQNPFGADACLSRYVTALLGRRMLGDLAEAELAHIPALNVNLPMDFAMTPGFTAVRQAARTAGTLLGVELALAEVMTDLPAFFRTRDRLRAEGCTVVLDGVDHHSLVQCDPAAFSADLLKLEWSPAIPTLAARDQRALRHTLDAFGAERVVIDRAETEASLVWGRTLGIACFQGRQVDLMLAADRIRACTHATSCMIRQCIDRSTAVSGAGQSGCRDLALLGRLPKWAPNRPASVAA